MKEASPPSVSEDRRLAYIVEEALTLLSTGHNKIYAEARDALPVWRGGFHKRES